MKKEVVIVGAGPSGLAVSACLNMHKIPNVLLEREGSYAYLWKEKAYDRVKLHLAKEFCSLPHMPHTDSTPTYIPKDEFVRYLDKYVAKFNVKPVLNTSVELATYDEGAGYWSIKTRNVKSGKEEEYVAQFLVVATGENAVGNIPDIHGLKSFAGDVLHSSDYKSGSQFTGKNALVVGNGNSGMEIAYDLANHGAKTTITIRSPFHVLTKELIRLGMTLVPYLPLKLVDGILTTLGWFYYGDLSKYGIVRPELGPLARKEAMGTSAVIDVGTVQKIKSGEIQVVKEPVKISGNEVVFGDGKFGYFDVIVFATGYKSTANNWLKDEKRWLLNGNGFPRERFPNHWKGQNGLYCVGLARMGLFGIKFDAEKTADDIAEILEVRNKKKKLYF